MLKYVPALVLMLAASPVLAQSGATQNPPSPNSGSSAPQPSNSLPAGAATMNNNSVANPNVGGALGTNTTTHAAPAAGPSGAMSTTVPTPAR